MMNTVAKCGVAVALLAGTTATALEGDVPPCFPGAIYRKAVSDVGNWTGIEVTVKLPELITDPDRVNPANQRPLDNSSIYLGGHANGQEIDAGVSWEVIRDSRGQVSPQRVAYRPFIRNDRWINASATPGLYFFPGDVLWMRCELIRDELMELEVVLLERGPNSEQYFKDLGLETPQGTYHFQAVFDAPCFYLNGEQDFKRVNAIDQTGNEGRAAQRTAARQAGLVWLDAQLLRGDERFPFVPARFYDMRCPDRELVRVVPEAIEGNSSSELVELWGGKGDGP